MLRRRGVTIATLVSLIATAWLTGNHADADASSLVPLSVTHRTKVGSSFRLVGLQYRLDGRSIYHVRYAAGMTRERLAIARPAVAPGVHKLTVEVVYRGHGVGVFSYLSKYRFTVRSSHRFKVASDGKTSVHVLATERGGPKTPLRKRPIIEFSVTGEGAGQLPASPHLAKRSIPRHRYAVGMGVAGPTMRWGFVLQYFLTRALILDMTGGPSDDAITFSLGVKLRGPRLPIVHPYIGAMVANTHRFDDGSDQVSNSLGVRAGFDIRFPGDRWVLGVEGGIARGIGGEVAPEWGRFASGALSLLF